MRIADSIHMFQVNFSKSIGISKAEKSKDAFEKLCRYLYFKSSNKLSGGLFFWIFAWGFIRRGLIRGGLKKFSRSLVIFH